MSFSRINNGGQMQPGQVPPNQNFLNRPPGPIPVTHGNVQQQVNQQCFPLSSLPCPALSLSLWPCALTPFVFLLGLRWNVHAVLNPPRPLFSVPLFLPQSVVVGLPSVSQVTLMEDQQRQNNMVRIRNTIIHACMHTHRTMFPCKHRISPLDFLPFHHLVNRAVC